MSSTSESTVPDTEELAQFREIWRNEIRGRVTHSRQTHESTGNSQSSSTREDTLGQSPLYSLRPHLRSALEAYSLAVSREQSGNYPEATRLYRDAFRLDSNVDKAYHREQTSQIRQLDLTNPKLLDNLARLSLLDEQYQKATQVTTTLETLSTLIKSWPQPLTFFPENEARGVPINKLPDEIIISILYILVFGTDVSAIERFAAVSRRARMLSLDSTIWRKLVQITMVPSQSGGQYMALRDLAKRYHFDYRRVYVEHPRLRFDGVYICICHYMRNGLGENPWITISHLITYRRFLRFLPNGEVLSYRANEDQEIGDVVHALQPGLRRKDLCIGKWRLMGTTVYVTNLIEIMPSGRVDNYSFQMSLLLKSRPSLGRWNKLDFLSYESVNVSTGETSALSLRYERPFWFSRVRSYH